jgi:tetratricopeptide (TPR) repeat protein
MAIKGSLREASLPDVLQLLAMGQKTGCLSVTDRSSFGYIYFDRGRISYASIVNRRDRLGDMLVKARIIEPEQLERAIQAQANEQRDKRLGEILVQQGAISRDDLHHYVRVQIEEAVYFLFTWTQGTFSFEADVRPEENEVLVTINPESLLLEGARRVDEWSLIDKKVPSFDIIFGLDRERLDASAAQLTPVQERLLPLIDGRRDVTALVEASGIGEFEVGKALYGLATAAFLHRVGKSRPADELAREARVEEHRNLGVAFYKTGMLEEATREFRRVAELRDADVQSRFYLGLIALREDRLDDAVALLRDAADRPAAHAAVHHNLAYALERQGRYHEACQVLAAALDSGGGDDPRVRTSLGILALKTGDVAEADAALAAARSLWGSRKPSQAWFHYAALAAALANDTDRALDLVAEGLENHPHSAPLYNMASVIHERRGDFEAAARAAEGGLQEDGDPPLPQLQKNHGDALYRAGRYDDALEAYERAIRSDPSLGDDVYLRVGNIRFKAREQEAAMESWKRALELNPANDTARANLELARTLSP